MVKKKQSFLGAALSIAGQPSSKRLLAAFALLCSIGLIPLQIIFQQIDFKPYFNGLLLFATGCLGGTVIESFKEDGKENVG